MRLRIIQALIGHRLTTADLARELPEVSPASLYRHLNRLVQGGMVSVVGQNRVRGAQQRVYAVALDRMEIKAEELRRLSREDHMGMFTAFIAAVLDGFQRYLTQDRLDLHADGVRYRQFVLHLDEDEFRRVLADVDDVISKAMVNPAGPDRRPRTFTNIIIPEPVTQPASP